MQSYNLDILGISECRWTESGKLKLTSGESVIYSGREDGMHRSGVAIMMSKHEEASLMEWQPINRVIMARFYSKYIKLTIIHTYAPTLDAEDEDKELFYEQLQSTVEKVNKHDLLLIITGDMNAKVGSSNHNRERVMGKHGTGILEQLGDHWNYFPP